MLLLAAILGFFPVLTPVSGDDPDPSSRMADLRDWAEDPFALAAAGRWVEFKALLRRRPALANDQNVAGIRPLHLAAREGRPELVRFLLELGAEPGARDRLLGWTALHYASHHGNEEAVRALLARSADPDAQDAHGDAPLHLAARAERAEVAETLLLHHAIPDLTNNAGQTPLHALVEGVAERLIPGNGNRPELLAAETIIHSLSHWGGDPTIRDHEGRTPVILAMEERCPHTLLKLLRQPHPAR